MKFLTAIGENDELIDLNITTIAKLEQTTDRNRQHFHRATDKNGVTLGYVSTAQLDNLDGRIVPDNTGSFCLVAANYVDGWKVERFPVVGWRVASYETLPILPNHLDFDMTWLIELRENGHPYAWVGPDQIYFTDATEADVYLRETAAKHAEWKAKKNTN